MADKFQVGQPVLWIDGKREPINWGDLWAALGEIGLYLNNDFGYVKKCTFRGKVVDIFDPTQDGGNYGQGDECLEASEIAELEKLDGDLSRPIPFKPNGHLWVDSEELKAWRAGRER